MQRFRLFWLICLLCIGFWGCQSTAPPLVESAGQTIPLTTTVGEVEIPFETLGVRSFFRAKTEFRQSNCLIMVKWTVKFTDLG